MGSKDGTAVVVGVVVPVCDGAPVGAVVAETVGGGSAKPLRSGGGLVGLTREDPKMFTSICCAAG